MLENNPVFLPLAFWTFILIIITACTPPSTNTSNYAIISIKINSDSSYNNKPTTYSKTRSTYLDVSGNAEPKQKSQKLPTLPSEVDKLILYLETESGNTLFQGDILAEDSELNFNVPTNVNLRVGGEIWAGEELLYDGSQAIAALQAGEPRFIQLDLNSLITLDINTPNQSAKPGLSQNISAKVNGLIDESLRWYVDGIEGGNTTVGTVTNEGIYTAPSNPDLSVVSIEVVPVSAPSFSKTIEYQITSSDEDNPNNGDSNITDPISSKSAITQLITSKDNTCAIAGNSVNCWGNRTDNLGKTIFPSEPDKVVISTYQICGLINGTILCFGENSRRIDIPVLTKVTDLSASNSVICAIVNNAVQCWGYNHNKLIPLYDTIINPTAITSADDHACATTENKVRCWRYRNFEEFSAPDQITIPDQYFSGHNTTCAVQTNELICWDLIGRRQFETNNTFSNIIKIALYRNHICVLDDNGVTCWGRDDVGELVVPTNLINPIDISTSEYYSCALTQLDPTSKAEINCWGIIGEKSFEFIIPSNITLNYSLLTEINHKTITIEDGGILNAPALNTLTESYLAMRGSAKMNTAGLSNIDLSRLILNSGAVFSEVTANSYYYNGGCAKDVFSATGSGTFLDLSSIETLHMRSYCSSPKITISALQDATIDLSGLTTLTVEGKRCCLGGSYLVTDETSEINFDRLSEFNTIGGARNYIQLNHSLEPMPNLNYLDGGIFSIAAGKSLILPSLTALLNAEVNVDNGATFSAPFLTNIMDSTLEGDGEFDLP